MNKASFARRFSPAGGRFEPAEGVVADSDQTPFLRQYGRMAWRWRKVILGALATCILIGLVVTLLMTPQYTAVTTVEIARDANKVVNIQGVEQGASEADQEFYQTQYGLLRARSLAERVATQLKLADDPAFFQLFDADPDEKLFADAADRRLAAAGRDKRIRIAGAVLLDNVRVAPTRLSRLVDVSFTSPDPNLSQRVANAWAENFIASNLERRFEASSYARNFLESRLGQLRVRLNDSERALMTYARTQRIITLPGAGKDGSEQSTVAFDLMTMNNALQVATTERTANEARYLSTRDNPGEVTEALENNALNTMRSKRAELDAEYRKLLTQFEPAYPPAMAARNQIAQLDRSIAREEARISGTIRTNYETSRSKENELRGRVANLENEFLDQRRRSIDYRVLEREVDTNRQLYNALLQRYKEIGIAGGVGTNNVSVVDAADRPERPSSPRLLLNMALSIFAGMAIGILLAFLLEQSDETISDPSEAERLIGLPLLGSVPKLATGQPIDALDDRKSPLVDAYLAVQTNLQFSTEHGVPRTVAVTSTRPAEGKSTTALALATLLARSQRKTILIDGDMRSPSVHRLIGVDHDRGLSNYLAGNAALSDLIMPVPRFGFAAMTAGPIPPNAAELLTGNRLSILFEELLQTFDHVVIDAPPVMGLADVPLIAGRVDGVVYAVESHGIRASLVRTALARLQSANARLLGIVVTKFEAKRANKGYGYEYGYDYGRAEKRKTWLPSI